MTFFLFTINQFDVYFKEKWGLNTFTNMSQHMTWRRMNSRFGNLCCDCRKNIYVGSPIFWNNDGSHQVKHYDCGSDAPLGDRAISVPGESVDSSALSWGSFPVFSQEESDEVFEKKNFEQRKQEREFFREGISP